jgi:adenine-specific DNA methylase
MFTHQDAGVWADLGAILWAAGLRVSAAWNIVTETESALKEPEYRRAAERIHHALYVAVREQAGREASPTMAIIDSQSGKAAQKGALRLIRRASMRARRSRDASAICHHPVAQFS